MLNYYFVIFTYLFFSYIITFIADVFLLKYIINNSARYYLMHFFLNLNVVYLTYSDTYYYLLNPLSITNEYSYDSIASVCIIISFHLYHFIHEKLDLETKIHHIVSVFMCASSGLTLPTGPSIGAINYFMCGLPGGLDYMMLFLVKYKYMNKLTEKYYNRWLNLLIRMPGMMICFWYLILNVKHGRIRLYNYSYQIISCFLLLLNSIYYCNKTVGNYHVRNYEYLLLKNKNDE